MAFQESHQILPDLELVTEVTNSGSQQFKQLLASMRSTLFDRYEEDPFRFITRGALVVWTSDISYSIYHIGGANRNSLYFGRVPMASNDGTPIITIPAVSIFRTGSDCLYHYTTIKGSAVSTGDGSSSTSMNKLSFYW